MSRVVQQFRNRVDQALTSLAPNRAKEAHELSYWKATLATEGALANDHYEYFYTDFFGLSRTSYLDTRMLDVGCGPRGSLEWAIMAAERVGIDPLAGRYMKLGASKHSMSYVKAPSERMPFASAHFDVVSTLNSLDHVANLDRTVSEISRVLRPGGTLLVVVEVNHPPSATEPISLSWDVPAVFKSFARIEDEKRFEIGEHDIYAQLQSNTHFDDSNPTIRPGIFAGRFTRL